VSEPVAWLIVYGDIRDHRCVVLDRARAEQNAANCHGLLIRLVVHPEDVDLLRTAPPPHAAMNF